jgi:glutamate-ammonia-ligase adenylyltransferase
LLEVLARPQIGIEQTDQLAESLKLWTELSQILKLCIEGPFEIDEAPQGLFDVILRTTNMPDIKILNAEIKDHSARIRKVFNQVLTRV